MREWAIWLEMHNKGNKELSENDGYGGSINLQLAFRIVGEANRRGGGANSKGVGKKCKCYKSGGFAYIHNFLQKCSPH